MAEVGQTHHASSSPGGYQDLLENEGASQEEVRSLTDAGREWAEGESVRARKVSNSFLACDLRVSACRLSIRQKAFSGFCPSCSYRRDEAGSSGFQVNTTSAAYGRKAAKLMLDSASGGFGFRLGRAWE